MRDRARYSGKLSKISNGRPNLCAASCASATTCTSVGHSDAIIDTADGTSWASQNGAICYDLRVVSCLSTAICYAVGITGIIETTNGGGNWTLKTNGTTQYFAGLTCPGPSQCLAMAGSVNGMVCTASRCRRYDLKGENKRSMEDIVAVKVTLDNGESRFFVTWGRIFSAVDPSSIEQLIRKYCTHVALGGAPVSVELFDSLQEAAHERYFYESFFTMCQKRIPFGPGYSTWTTETAEKMKSGQEIYYLGKYDAGP